MGTASRCAGTAATYTYGTCTYTYINGTGPGNGPASRHRHRPYLSYAAEPELSSVVKERTNMTWVCETSENVSFGFCCIWAGVNCSLPTKQISMGNPLMRGTPLKSRGGLLSSKGGQSSSCHVAFVGDPRSQALYDWVAEFGSLVRPIVLPAVHGKTRWRLAINWCMEREHMNLHRHHCRFLQLWFFLM